jgi:putative phage-type endonuclease
MVDTIKLYCNNSLEQLEKELTDISFIDDNFMNSKSISNLKYKYKEHMKQSITELTDDIQYYIDILLELWFQKSLTNIYDLHIRRPTIELNMLQLKKLKLPEQRSKEWYDIRENLLTASSLADALGKGHFNTRDGLLISKTSNKKETISNISSDIMQWGVKYEPVATEFYEHLHNLKIIEFGLIPHPNLSVFGASPDGICDIGSPNGYAGRMLEIKCPPKRKFTHEVPLHYWMQMQGQLEVCDLDECDFFQVKLEEYSNVHDYEKDYLYTNGIQSGYTEKGMPKGVLLSYKNNGNYEYLYSPWLSSLDDILNWVNNQKAIHKDKIYEEKWWRIERYESTLVRRDKAWWTSIVPDIIKFWSEVIHYRKEGNDEVQNRINSRKRGPRKKVFTIQPPIKGYLIDSDDD